MSKLIIVPTPIGNLKDITFRAIEVLETADLILAEDTRTSGKLLKHYEITTPSKSFHKFNEHRTVDRWVNEIKAGKTIVLISDAGTPAISDPGYLIVKACLDNDVEVEALPGATAFVPALIKSGFALDSFIYEGFFPQKKGRVKKLTSLIEEPKTVVFYESPHRLLKTLKLIQEHLGNDRKVSVSRELTKMFEETVTNPVTEVIEYYENNTIKGEIVIVIEGFKK